MAWNNISKYLEKFFTITPPGKFYQKEIAKTLNEILNINLSENDVEYRFGTIYIKNPAISGTLKKRDIFKQRKSNPPFVPKKIKNSGIKRHKILIYTRSLIARY